MLADLSSTQVPPFAAKSIYFRLCDTTSQRYSAVLKWSWFQQTFQILEGKKTTTGQDFFIPPNACFCIFLKLTLSQNPNVSPVIWESNYAN